MSENVMLYREPVYFFLLEAIPNQNLGLVKLKCNLHIRNIQVTCIHNMYIHKVLGLLKCCFKHNLGPKSIILATSYSYNFLLSVHLFSNSSKLLQILSKLVLSCPNFWIPGSSTVNHSRQPNDCCSILDILLG